MLPLCLSPSIPGPQPEFSLEVSRWIGRQVVRSWEEVWCKGMGSCGGQQDRGMLGPFAVSVSHPSQSQVAKPVCCLPPEPLPGPDMKRLWPIFVLWVFWTLIFWLMASCLDMKPALAPQEKLMYLVPWCCNCPWSKFRKCGCPSGTLNDSSCHHMVREQNWFGARYEKAMGSFTGARESMISDTGFDGGSVVNTVPSPIPCPSQAKPISHFPSPNPWLSASPILTASTPDLQMEASPTQVCFPSTES